jgi:imidazolonepropionase-like amidohydrolase
MTVPDGAVRIEGHGAYLMPGLADMHTHVTAKEDLELLVANGVTAMLQMGRAPPSMVDHGRERIAAGKWVGPRLFFAFMVDGTPEYSEFFVSDPDEARSVVRLAKTNRYDFIKVYNNVTKPEFEAFIDEGRKLGIPVVGHAVRAEGVGLPGGLQMGQMMVAHAEEFVYTAFDNGTDESKIPAVTQAVRETGAYVTATLSTFEAISRAWGKPAEVAKSLKMPEALYMSPQARAGWQTSDYQYRSLEKAPMIAASLVFQRHLVKAFADGGVPILTGTDTPTVPGLVPGFSLHDELRNLSLAGLSNYQVLVAATKAPGEFIHKAHPDAARFGQVSVGMRADLLLVKGNPLEQLETVNHPLGVMADGRWFSAQDLKALLEKLKQRYQHLDRLPLD